MHMVDTFMNGNAAIIRETCFAIVYSLFMRDGYCAANSSD